MSAVNASPSSATPAVRARARSLIYLCGGATLLACATSGGLSWPLALPLLATLLAGAFILPARESRWLTAATVLAVLALDIWSRAVAPLPQLWRVPDLPPASVVLAVALLVAATARARTAAGADGGGPPASEPSCASAAERRIAADEVRQLNETLEMRVAERTAELEAFTSSVSHDLRAPARQIASAAEIMLRKAGQPGSDLRPMLAALQTTADRMNRTIDALLELSRLGRAGIVPSRWSLAAMVQDIQAELSAGLGDRAVTWRISPLPHLYADPHLIRLVMVNLMDNAVKFTRHAADPAIEIWADDYENATAINVRDNGTGFDMRQAGKLFTMFTRLHSSRDFDGSGVGLAHCRRIVERHGGYIVAHGEPGKGATLRFTLPRSPKTGAA